MEKLQPDMIIYWFKVRAWSSQKPYLKPKERKLNTKHGIFIDAIRVAYLK